MNITQQTYQKSIELLKKNSTKHGFLAAGKSKLAKSRNYDSIFGRDAMICSLAAIITKDKELISTAKKSLACLAKNISPTGQIPFSVKFINGKEIVKHRVPQSIDGNLWWLVIYELFKKFGDKSIAKKYKKNQNWHFYGLNKEKVIIYLSKEKELIGRMKCHVVAWYFMPMLCGYCYSI